MDSAYHYTLTIGPLSDQVLWTQLLETVRPKTPFDLPIWHEIWLKHFGQHATPMIMSVMGQNSEDALVMPLVQEGDTVRFFGSTDCVDYHAILGNNITPDILIPVVRAITEDTGIQHVILGSMLESGTLHCLKEIFEQQGWYSELHLEDVAPRISLPTSWDAYLAALSRKRRHEIRRKIRRLEKSGTIRHGDVVTPTGVAQAMDTFIALHKKSSAEKTII